MVLYLVSKPVVLNVVHGIAFVSFQRLFRSASLSLAVQFQLGWVPQNAGHLKGPVNLVRWLSAGRSVSSALPGVLRHISQESEDFSVDSRRGSPRARSSWGYNETAQFPAWVLRRSACLVHYFHDYTLRNGLYLFLVIPVFILVFN